LALICLSYCTDLSVLFTYVGCPRNSRVDSAKTPEWPNKMLDRSCGSGPGKWYVDRPRPGQHRRSLPSGARASDGCANRLVSPPTLCRRKGDWQAREGASKNSTLPTPFRRRRRRKGVGRAALGRLTRQLAFQSSLHRRGVGGGVRGFVVVAVALVGGRIMC
jgi:hypothetical protein